MEKILSLATSGNDTNLLNQSWEEALEFFNQRHSATKALSKIYGEASKRILVQCLYVHLRHASISPSSRSSWTPSVIASALLALRTALRERIAIDELLTSEAMKEVFLVYASSTRQDYIKAQVPVNSLRCIMNIVAGEGGQGIGMMTYHRCMASSVMLHTIEGPTLTCVGMELALRILYFTSGVMEGGLKALVEEKEIIKTLIPTVAWVIRNPSPAFPHGEGRIPLTKILLKFICACRHISSTGSSSTITSRIKEDEEWTKQLGQVLVDILLLPHRDSLVYQTQLEVINILMDSPPDWVPLLTKVEEQGQECGREMKIISSLLDIFQVQLEQIAVERRGNPATVLTPILAVLTTLVQRSLSAKQYIKATIFPNPAPPPPPSGMGKKEEDDEKQTLETRITAAARNLDPKDAPAYSLRAQLLSIMQIHEATANRTAAELVYQLCDEDGNEFIARSGFGNAAGLLKIKGLLEAPEEPTNSFNSRASGASTSADRKE